MTILQNFRPMTRAKMAQLSLPDIRAYATAYKVPADVIESGTVDELLDLIFELRPRHPSEYPINTPYLFTHEIARTQQDRDEEFHSHKYYAGFTYRENIARFRRAASWIGRPSGPNEEQACQEDGAVRGEPKLGETKGKEPGYPSAHHEDLLVMGQPVASSSRTPIYEQPNPLAEHPQERLSPFSNPSHLTLSQVPNQDPLLALADPLPSNDDPTPSQPEKRTNPSIPTSHEQRTASRGSQPETTTEERMEFIRKASRGNRPPPVPPALGFEVADDLSNLKSALEEHQEAIEATPKPSRIIVDDELFDLEFTPDMTRAGKEAVICERYAIAMSNHKMIEQMLAEAEAEVKQALWQLTAIQPQLNTAHDDMQRFLDESAALTGRPSIIGQAVFDCEKMAKDAWEFEWNEEWVSTKDDEKDDEMMRKIAQARAAGVQLSPSPSPPTPRSRKRTRDEVEDELEYADEEELGVGIPEPNPKRPRTESSGASTAPSSPSPGKGKGKGKGRALAAEDSYTLPFPSSPFHMPTRTVPRFGPKDRCNVCPVYKPAIPGYEPPQPTAAEDGNQPEQHDGGHLPPSDEDEAGPEPDQGQAHGDTGGEEQIGGGGSGHHEVGNTEEPTQSTTEMHRGAPPPAAPQPQAPRRGDPWQVLRYDRAVWTGYVVTDHTRMPSDLKRPVDWSIMGARHPKSANFREWDDGLEEQNPWHQGGRPVLKH